MKQLLKLLFAGLASAIMLSCSPVRFYSDKELTEKSGFSYYSVKPFLLVERDVASMNIVKTTVIYLPDIDNPHYLALKEVPGSAKADIKLENGSITSLGISSDMKLAETLDALAGLVSRSASAVADLSVLKGNYPGAGSSTVTELYEVIMSGGITSVRKIEF